MSTWQQTTPVGTIAVDAGPRGVREIRFGDDLPGTPGQRRDRSVASQLDEWFAGTRHQFQLDVDFDGHDLPPSAVRVYDVLRGDVPWGETVSYGELAGMAAMPGAARAVGSIMRRNPVPFVIPCHRVVAAGGKLGGYGGGATTGGSLHIKRWLLAHEGVLLL